MKIIVGLGNPGEKYLKTRHNLGFEILEKYAAGSMGGEWEENEKLKCQIFKTPEIILAKPLTFMNNSGLAIRLLTAFYQIPTTDVVVIHDDLDMKLGRVKIRQGGSAAGHHGVESIINSLGSDDFIRLRVGIGNAQSHSGEQKKIHFSAEKFVLEPFMPKERAAVKRMIKKAVEAIASYLEYGLEVTQNQYH